MKNVKMNFDECGIDGRDILFFCGIFSCVSCDARQLRESLEIVVYWMIQ